MIQVALDTSFLISFADPNRPNHQAAVQYFRHCIEHRYPLWISTIVAGEFHVGQPFNDLPLQNFRIQPYNLPHAIRAAEFLKALRAEETQPENDSRRIIINDLKIIAQASDDEIPIILSEDHNTLQRLADRLRHLEQKAPHVLLLREGFTPRRLTSRSQPELPLSADSPQVSPEKE